MPPEEYHRTISEGFGAATGWITFLLALVAAIVGLGVVFWLMYVRGVSLGDGVNRLLAVLPSTHGKRLLSLARVSSRVSFGLGAVHLLAAGILSYGSIPVAVILPLFDCRPGKGDRVDLRKWMLHPDQAQELVLRFTGRGLPRNRPSSNAVKGRP